jgi:hypothetical protein
MAHVSKDQQGKVIIRDDWHIEDIRSMLENGQELTDDECIEIMEIIADNFDANIGINWEVIGYHLYRYLDDRDELLTAQENFETEKTKENDNA